MKKLRKRIPRVSKRRQKDNAVYAKKKKEFLEQFHRCGVCDRLLYGWDRELHHRAGRIGRLLLEESLWMCVCPPCHKKIHDHPAAARTLGYLSPKGCWNDYKRAMAARPEVRK